MNPCQRCTRPTAGALCVRCTVHLVSMLKALPALLRELGVVVARQDHLESAARPVYGRQGNADGVSDADAASLLPARLRRLSGPIALPATPWAFAPDAAVLLRQSRTELAAWVDHVRTSRGLQGAIAAGPACVACDHPSCRRLRARRRRLDSRGVDVRLSIWLIRHRADLAQDDRAGELVDSITAITARLRAAIDRREPDVFLGPCASWEVDEAGERTDAPLCPVELYAHEGDQSVECEACGTRYDVSDRKGWLLAHVRGEWRPVREVADACSGLLSDERGETVVCTPSMVRGWVDRRQLQYRGVDADGRQLVRVGDVETLLLVKLARDRARRERLANRPRRAPAKAG